MRSYEELSGGIGMNDTQSGIRHILKNGFFRAAFAVSLLAGAKGIPAHVFDCITTATNFQNALDAAAGTYSAEDNYIQLGAGTYKTGGATGNGPFHFTSTSTHILGIRGGATSNCQQYGSDATLAKLDGNNTTQVLRIENPNGYLFIVDVTIQNGKSTTNGGGLAVNQSGHGNEVQITNDIFYHNQTTANGGAFALYTDYANLSFPEIILGGNLIYDNLAVDDGAGLVMEDNEPASISNNTIYNNTATATGGTGGLAVGGTGASQIFNNIFWGNSNYGLNLLSAGIVVSYNDYGTITGMTADASSTANLSKNPMFVDTSTNNFHLSGSSPLLGQGLGSKSTSSDLDGYEYSPKNKVDMGAYEETIFVDGFDGD
jgi:hypothetical protein